MFSEMSATEQSQEQKRLMRAELERRDDEYDQLIEQEQMIEKLTKQHEQLLK
jgi:hypothetical protein